MTATTIDQILAHPFGTLSALIRLHARRGPQRLALKQGERRVDYATLDAMMDRIAISLRRHGVKDGEVIAICAGTSMEYVAVFLGALRAGVAVAPLAPSSTPESLAAMIADAQAGLLFLDASTARALASLGGRISATKITMDGSAAEVALESWLAGGDIRPVETHVKPEAAFNLIYSSGTTGTPKGIVQPHSMRWVQWQRAGAYGYTPDAITLVSTPLYSNTTLVSLLPTLALGGCCVLMPTFNALGFLALAQEHGVTHAMLVPVQYQRIMGLSEFGQYDLSAFRAKFCTSSPFSAALKADVVKRWPGTLIEYYGMTEGGGTCVLEAHLFPDKLHTVGKPAPGHDMRVIDEQGNELPKGQTGEIVGHSASMMNGYYNRPELTAQAEWFDASGKRFIRTGDIGRFDEDGFLILMDRRKDLIITGGFNVYPSDIEAVLLTHPDVADASVVGVPSERWGETPVAFVIRRPNATLSTENLKEWANKRLGKTQRLAAVEFSPDLPRNAIGKVLKRELRARWIAAG
jgi:long-chain acyl-CoA synthetase